MTTTNTRFEQEAMPHLPELYGMALKYTHDESDAEDLVQDSLFKAYRSFASYQEGTNCRAWLFRILTNTFINKYRHKKREKAFIEQALTSHQELMPSSRQPDSALENDESTSNHSWLFSLSDEMLKALNAISDDSQNIIILADIQELSYKEIAATLNIPIGTVMSRLCRSRQMLREYLTKHSHDAYCTV